MITNHNKYNSTDYPIEYSLKERTRKILKSTYLYIRNGILQTCLPDTSSNVKIDPEEIHRILIVRFDRLGDMVLTIPLFETLRKLLPNCELTVAAFPSSLALLENNPFVNHRREIPSRVRSLFLFIFKIRAMKFDLVIDGIDDYRLFSAFFCKLLGSSYQIGFNCYGRGIFFTNPILDSDTGLHFTERVMLITSQLKSKETIFKKIPKIYLDDNEKENAEKELSALSSKRLKIGFHPGGFYKTQQLPAITFATVAIELAKNKDIDIFIFGSSADEKIIQEIQSLCTIQLIQCTGHSLRHSIALMSYMDIMVCNNTGPLHMAGAVGCATVSTMGPTDHKRFWPLGDRQVVIRKRLWCSPCQKVECKPHYCLNEISRLEILEKIEILIRKVKSSY